MAHAFFKAYDGVLSNGFRKGLEWPKVPTKEEMPTSFITLWKSALDKCFLNNCSSIKRLLATGKQLGGWTD